MKYNLLSSRLVLGDELWQNLSSRYVLPKSDLPVLPSAAAPNIRWTQTMV